MNKTARLIAAFLPMIAVCAVIFWFSSNAAEDSSKQSSAVVDIVKKDMFPELNELDTERDTQIVEDVISHIVRKTAHFSIYTLLGICAFGGYWFLKKKHMRFFAAWGTATLYEVSDEIHQYFVPGRSCELRDVCSDSTGAALGAGICLAAVLLAAYRKSVKRIIIARQSTGRT
jgi:VanZ family protein